MAGPDSDGGRRRADKRRDGQDEQNEQNERDWTIPPGPAL
jgi:hypothetical protein